MKALVLRYCKTEPDSACRCRRRRCTNYSLLEPIVALTTFIKENMSFSSLIVPLWVRCYAAQRQQPASH